MLNSSVLLLNHNFTPLTTCSAKRAVLMVWTGKAEVIETSGRYLHSVSMRFDIPAIIRLLVFVKVNFTWDVQLTKQNIIRRDQATCQYCGSSDGPMTIDHVIPRSLGGVHEWHNLVCACSACNNVKGNRTPVQAGMRLRKKPGKPTVRSMLFNSKKPLNSIWQAYL